ncbi:cbb3-type cytochrome c oxidase subunit I [Tenacibaculum insulae]|uniref:cbb3-type cytochrome c oxidase subunit I n=1 Tax=Tenacibaculum insulae TaxID=2029677 RepID=UPI003AB5489E
MKNKTALYFLILSLSALLLGILFGLLASLQYIFPEMLKEIIPFSKMRPFHVSTVISWIILSVTGGVYYYLTEVEKLPLFSFKLQKTHFYIFLLSGVGIYISFITGNMNGREYLAFTPFLTIPILIGWILFGVNYYKTLIKKVKNWPVYYWMWGTGIVFMIYHLCESHFWLIPSFREYFIKDISVQWKSYGSFVGSWNMLVYGTAIYVMSKIKSDEASTRGKKVFFFYFLGLTNLMFGWAHHTYIIPTQPWIRYVAYGISMTEWVVLANIIYVWKKSLNTSQKEGNIMAYKFLVAADFWVFLNIILALLFSIPAINFFTHGTHITVAHSMGTTIGINTTILLASLFFIAQKTIPTFKIDTLFVKRNYYLFQGSLLLFFCTLLYAGAIRSHWMYFTKEVHFSEMQDGLYGTYIAFFLFGVCLVISIISIALILLKAFIKALKS